MCSYLGLGAFFFSTHNFEIIFNCVLMCLLDSGLDTMENTRGERHDVWLKGAFG